jgi:hypothetical protein
MLSSRRLGFFSFLGPGLRFAAGRLGEKVLGYFMEDD